MTTAAEVPAELAKAVREFLRGQKGAPPFLVEIIGGVRKATKRQWSQRAVMAALREEIAAGRVETPWDLMTPFRWVGKVPTAEHDATPVEKGMPA